MEKKKQTEKEFMRTAFPKKVVRGYTAGRINLPDMSVVVNDGPSKVRIEVFDIRTGDLICATVVQRVIQRKEKKE